MGWRHDYEAHGVFILVQRCLCSVLRCWRPLTKLLSIDEYYSSWDAAVPPPPSEGAWLLAQPAPGVAPGVAAAGAAVAADGEDGDVDLVDVENDDDGEGYVGDGDDDDSDGDDDVVDDDDDDVGDREEDLYHNDADPNPE